VFSRQITLVSGFGARPDRINGFFTRVVLAALVLT
jgi:hypothetical protein